MRCGEFWIILATICWQCITKFGEYTFHKKILIRCPLQLVCDFMYLANFGGNIISDTMVYSGHLVHIFDFCWQKQEKTWRLVHIQQFFLCADVMNESKMKDT
jgi:hypothetical protein